MQWIGSPNYWPGRQDTIAIVLHTMVGTLAGTDSTFANSANQVSSHYGVGLDGTIHQYVNLGDSAWANGGPNAGWRWPFGDANPNRRTISIETEDNGQPDTQPVTDAQYAAVLSICRAAMANYPSIKYLVAHVVVNPAHSCPAKRWLDSGRFDQLASDLGLEALK